MAAMVKSGGIASQDTDRRVAALANTFAEAYAGNLWLGHVFLSRANRGPADERASRSLGGFEVIPGILKSDDIQSYVPKGSRFLNFKTINLIGVKVLKTVWSDYAADGSNRRAALQDLVEHDS